MNKIIKWGIIGLGNAAINLAKTFSQISNSQLIAVASKTDHKRNFFYREFEIEKKNIYDNYEDILNNPNVDIVFISLPHTLHKEWCIKAAIKKKNILVEKPAALSLKDIKEILSHVKSNNVFFSEGLAYKFHPFFKEILTVLKNTKLQDIASIRGSFGNDALGGKKFFGFRFKRAKKSKRLFNPELAGGAIWDAGCYPVSIITEIISCLNQGGSIKPKILEISQNIGSTGVDEHSSIKLKFGNILVSIETSLVDSLPNNIEVELVNGKIIINNPWFPSSESYIETITNSNKKIIKCKNEIDSYESEIQSISSFLLNNDNNKLEHPLLTHKNILENIEILELWSKN